MIEMQALAKAQASITGDSFDDWYRSIEWAASSRSLANLTDGEFVHLIRQSQSQLVYQTVVEAFEQHHDTGSEEAGYDMVIRFVDDSTFSFGEWVCALSDMSRWLKSHNQSADLTRSLGYIKCCAASAENLKVPLPNLVIDMLEQHGLESI